MSPHKALTRQNPASPLSLRVDGSFQSKSGAKGADWYLAKNKQPDGKAQISLKKKN